MGTVTLVLAAIRTLAVLLPSLITDGKGQKAADILNTVATLGDRGSEGYEELKTLTAKLEQMKGVSGAERDALWATIESQHEAIQAAARLI